MNTQNKPIEIYIRTLADKKESKEGLQEGSNDVASPIMDAMYSRIRQKVALEEKDENEKTPLLEKVLTETNKVINKIVENIAENVNHEKVKSIEVEFGISFAEKLQIYVFEAGSEQSLKFKVTIEK